MRGAVAALFSLWGGLAQACVMMPMPDPMLGSVGNDVWYSGATSAYPHGVLGDGFEAKSLYLRSERADRAGHCGVFIAHAGEGHVFEDTVPRLIDMDGDGVSEVIAVRSSFTKGAQLVVYREGDNGRLDVMARTDYIGQRFRWLAVIGAADLDGDGQIEIAYIDRPHLAKVLRVVAIEDGALVEKVAGEGVTNHRIGERDIAGGIRNCGSGGPEMIVANANWTALLAVAIEGGTLTGRQINNDTSRPAFAAAMACK